jgi:large subunit ribosomal protein L31
MKKGIHPTCHVDCSVTCACGNTFTTGSTYTSLQVDICSACHPFFTGEMNFVDTQGRVDRFMQKMKAASTIQNKRAKKAKQQTQAPQEPAKTYKQLLQEQKAIVKKGAAKSAIPATATTPATTTSPATPATNDTTNSAAKAT